MHLHYLSLCLISRFLYASDCNDPCKSGDHQLNSQVFFPTNSGGDPNASKCASSGANPQQGGQGYGAGQQQGGYPQQPVYQPPPSYAPPPPSYSPPPQQNQSGGGKPAITCDNTGEREAFKQCVSDALKSLRNILENCRNTLGKKAKECCLSEDCLFSLTGKKRGDVESSDDGSDDDEDFYAEKSSKHGGKSGIGGKESGGDSLAEFIKYLESQLNKKGDKNEGNKSSANKKNNRNKNKGGKSRGKGGGKNKHKGKKKGKGKKSSECEDECDM